MSSSSSTDVLVIGSGASGLTAALTATSYGAKVTVLESSSFLGGTSAFSGGMVWTPNNHYMQAAGYEDSREDALSYFKSAQPKRHNDTRIQVFIDTVPEMVRFIEDATCLRFSAMTYPDSFAELKGGKPGGRHLEPKPFPVRSLGQWRKKLRKPATPHIFTFEEVHDAGLAIDPMRAPKLLAISRLLKGRVTLGSALIAGLLKACLDKGVIFRLSTKALSPVMENGAVTGVLAETPDKPETFQAKTGVIIASGGFEWSTDLRDKYLDTPASHMPSASSNTGGGLLLALEAGAKIEHMSDAWWWPASKATFPAETPETGQLVISERSLPHSIIVNKDGQRFVNETSHNMAEAFRLRDNKGHLKNLPAWAVFDQQYRSKYTIFLKVRPSHTDPDWFVSAPTLKGLAQKIGVNAEGLEETVQGFNEDARRGTDSQFGRGSTLFDTYGGDPDAPHPNLGTLEKGPFYAVPIHASMVGTKGGIATDTCARALSETGAPIKGLWAAGNAMSAFIGPETIAGGATIASGMTWGYLAALNALNIQQAGQAGGRKTRRRKS